MYQHRSRFYTALTGFTLVEVMLVLSIVGVMSSIAIPQYQRYQERTRQSEVKIALGSIYTAQQGYFAEYATYSSCLRQIGVSFSPGSRRYYAVGSDGGSFGMTPACDPNTEGDTMIGANSRINSNSTILTFANLQGSGGAPFSDSTVTKDGFFIPALGNVSVDNVTDKWTIDQNKTLLNSGPL